MMTDFNADAVVKQYTRMIDSKPTWVHIPCGSLFQD